MSGTWGKILRVNLTDSTIIEKAIPEEWVRKFLGGRRDRSQIFHRGGSQGHRLLRSGK